MRDREERRAKVVGKKERGKSCEEEEEERVM